MTNGTILQAMTVYAKATKTPNRVMLEIGKDGIVKLATPLRLNPDAGMGFTRRIRITMTYEGEV